MGFHLESPYQWCYISNAHEMKLCFPHGGASSVDGRTPLGRLWPHSHTVIWFASLWLGSETKDKQQFLEDLSSGYMYIYIPITHPRPYEQKAYCFGWQVVLILTRKWTRAPCPVSLEWSLVAGWLQFVPKTPTCKKWFCAKQVWASQFFRKKNTLPGLFQQQSVPQNISKPIYLKNMGQLAFPRWHRLSWRETTPYLLAFFSPLVLGPLIPSWKWVPATMLSESLYADHQFGWEALPSDILNLQIFCRFKNI